MKRPILIIILFLLIAYSLQSQSNDRKVYDLLLKFGEQYAAGDMKKGKETLLEILESKDKIYDLYLVITYNDLGVVNMVLGNYNEALNNYTLAENLIISKKLKTPYPYLADIYTNKGSVYSVKNSFSEALKYLEMGLRIISSIKNPDKLILGNLSTAYLNTGIAYYKIEDYKKASELLWKSIDLKIKYDLPQKAQPYINIANVYEKTGDYEAAEKYFLMSIEGISKEMGPNYYRLTAPYFDYSLLLSSEGREEESFLYSKKALNICLNKYESKHPFTSLAYRHIGDHYLIIAKYDSALFNYQKSLIAGVLNFNNPDINSNPPLDSVAANVDLVKILKNKSEALIKLGLKQDNLEIRKQFMKKSLETNEVILQLISNIRNNFISEESRTYLAANEKETYIFAIQAARNLYLLTKDTAYIRKMYKTVLKGKAAVLQKEVADNQLFHSKNTSIDLQQKLDSINDDIAVYKSLVLEESSSLKPLKTKLDIWNDTLFYLSSQKEKVIRKINEAFPQSLLIQQKTEPVSLEKIQAGLKKNETLIEYFFSNKYKEGKRSLFTFIVTKNQLNFTETFIDSIFVKDIELVRQFFRVAGHNQSSFNNLELFNIAQNNMYKTLIEPITGYFAGKKLIIIPDEEISFLSFDTFLKNKPEPGKFDFEDQKYLIYDYTFSYGYSSSLIFREEKERPKSWDFYAFSPNYNRNSQNNISNPAFLKGTSFEIKTIDKLFRCKKFTDESATEANFKSAIESPAVFHLAMHSYQDISNSKNSYLLFENKNDTIEDGKLFNYEIEFSRIKSPMVVLSACNTGTGTLYHGEGVMSLGRGFILAGARSVVKTLWEVNDDASSKIISNFYHFLSRGKDKDDALRLAKLEYLTSTSSAYKNPYYWGGYEVIGCKEAIVKNYRILFAVAGISFLILSVLIVYYFKFRKTFRARSL